MEDNLSVEDVVTTADVKIGQAAVSQAVDEVIASDSDENLLAGDVSDAVDNDLVEDGSAEEEAQEATDEEESDEQEEVEVEAEEKSELPKGSRAERRIQELNRRAKDAEDRALAVQTQYQQRFDHMQAQMAQQIQAQQQAYQTQLQYAQHQAYTAQQRQEAENLAKLSPAQRLEREWIQKARAEAESALLPKFQAMENQLAQERQMRTQITESVKRRNELQTYKTNANATASKVLFGEFSPEVAAKIGPRVNEVLMTWDTAFGEGLDKSAASLKEAFETYHQAKLKSISAKSGQKIKQSQAAPKPLPTNKVSAKGDARPSPQELKKMGYSDYVDWRRNSA